MYVSRCGVDCDACERKEEVGCTGCTNMENTFWGGDCTVKSCCEGKKLNHCGDCEEFPCKMASEMGKDAGFDPEPRLANCRKWAGKE